MEVPSMAPSDSVDSAGHSAEGEVPTGTVNDMELCAPGEFLEVRLVTSIANSKLVGGAPEKEEEDEGVSFEVANLDTLEGVQELDVLEEEEEAVLVLPDSILSDSEYESEEEDEEEMARREADRLVYRRDRKTHFL